MIIPFKWPWSSSGSSGEQVNSDWSATSGPAEVLNKPPLFSGNYADLTGKPSLFSGNYADLSGRPALSAVAASGSYTDLTNKPTIPAAQVPGDWSANSGASRILNKPVLFSGVYADLTGKPALFSGNYSELVGRPALAAVATSGAYVDLTGRPAIPAAQVQSDWNATAGLGVILNKPAIPTAKRTETYTGSTDANGLITVTYPTAFSVVPNVQPGPPPSSDMSWVLVSSTVNGFSIRLVQRSVLTVLALQVLAGTVTSVVGSPARVLVVES